MPRKRCKSLARDERGRFEELKWCLCGNPKERDADGCERCLMLDGDPRPGNGSRLIPIAISELRQSGPVPLDKIQEFVGITLSGTHRMVKAMERKGLIRVVGREVVFKENRGVTGKIAFKRNLWGLVRG